MSDSSGVALAGATVSAVESSTGQVIKISTDPNGAYKLTIAPGTYTLRFSAIGFNTSEVQSVVRQGDALTVNATLIADAGNEVSVDGSNALKGAPQQTVSPVKDIPLSSRNFTQAAGLSTGVSSTVANATAVGMNTQGVQVGSAPTNNYTIDGAPVSNSAQGPETPAAPSPDAIEKNAVQSWSYSPGPERYAGANISVVTKSGTDSFHGTLFEFVRNDLFNANDFFRKQRGQPEPVLKQNQFGLTIGGPVLRNRVYFFASYQGTRQSNGMAASGFSPSVILPPLPSTRTAATVGAAFCPANHPGDSRYRTVFGGVQVACDGSNISPVAIKYLNLKLPNSSYVVPGSSNGAFQQTPFSIPAKFREDQFLLNTDYVLSKSERLTQKFFFARDPQTVNFAASPSTPAGLPGAPTMTVNGYLYGVVQLASALTPTLTNTLRISGQHYLTKDTPQVPFTNAQVGIASAVAGIDQIDPINLAGLFNFGGNAVWDYQSVNQYQAADQVSWTRGKHSIRVGAEISRKQWNIDILGDSVVSLTFFSFGDFLLGLPGCPPGASACNAANPIVNGVNTNGTAYSNIYTSGGGNGFADVTGPAGILHNLRFSNAHAYFADDFKLFSRLTVTTGLRWDSYGVQADSTGNITGFWPSLAGAWSAIPSSGTFQGFVVPSNFKGTLAPGVVRNSRDTSLPRGVPRTNFAPRLGFSWQPLSKGNVVVNGGYGLFFDQPGLWWEEWQTTANVPFAVPVGFSGTANYRASLAQPFQPTPLGWGQSRSVDLASGRSSNLYLSTMDENFSTPLTQKWNFGIQEQLRGGVSVAIGYAGAHSVRLLDFGRQINEAQLSSPAHPLYGITTNTVGNAPLRVPYLGIAPNGFNDVQTQASAKFNSLQASIQERTSYGLHAQASYLFSKTLATIPSSPGSMNSNDPLNARQQYGPTGNGGNSVPQRLALNYGWDFPWKHSGILGRALDGWGFSGVTIIQTGTPLTLTDNRGGSAYGNAGNSRAQFCPGMTVRNVATPGSVKQRLNSYFNPAAFCAPPVIGDDGVATGYGNSPVGFILSPGQNNSDMSVMKMMPIKESKLEFRVEFFNAFNHAQFRSPDVSVTDGIFGKITQTSVNPRLIQFGLKYSF